MKEAAPLGGTYGECVSFVIERPLVLPLKTAPFLLL
jgi:hypothetical protein